MSVRAQATSVAFVLVLSSLVLPLAADATPASTPHGRAGLSLLMAPALAPPREALTPEQLGSAPPLPVIQGGIGPGSALQIQEGPNGFLCTGAFILRDPATATYYLATAGHCLARDETDPAPYTGAADPDHVATAVSICVSGCIDNALGIGTYVTLTPSGSYHPVTFTQVTATGGDDFGLIELPASVHAQLRPAMPQFGGPSGYDPHANDPLVVHYGHGTYCCPQVGGVASRTPADQGRVGVLSFFDPDNYEAYGYASGGDSGSAVNLASLGADGVSGTTALGVLDYGIITEVGYFGGTTLGKGLAMIQEHTGLSLELVPEGDPLPTEGTGPVAPAAVTIQSPAADAQLAGNDVVTVHGLAVAKGGKAPPADAEMQVAIDDPTFAAASRLPTKGTASWNATWYLSGEASGPHTILARLVAGSTVLAQQNRTVTVLAKGQSPTTAPTTSARPTTGAGTSTKASGSSSAKGSSKASAVATSTSSKASPSPAVASVLALGVVAAALRRRR